MASINTTAGTSVTAGPLSQEQYRQTLRDAIDAYEKEHGKQTTNGKHKSSKSQSVGDNDTATTVAKGKRMDGLPNELVELIFERLDRASLGHMRLMCRKFAVLAAPNMFKDGFEIKPHRQDMIRLARVCLSPQLSVGIKDLMIFMGDMNKHQFFAALHQMQHEDEHIPVEPVNRLFDKFSDHLDQELLAACFSQLPSIETINTYSEDSPFTAEAYHRESTEARGIHALKAEEGMVALDECWIYMHENFGAFDRTHPLNTEVSSQRTLNLLLALEHLPNRALSVYIDSLPLDMFAKDFQHLKRDFNLDAFPPIEVDVERLSAIQNAVKYLKGFEVTFDGSGKQDVIYTGAPLSKAITGFMGSMQNLKSLSITWQPEEEYDVDFATAFDESLFKLRFPHLQELQLADLCSVRGAVLPFILGHASTLLRLRWSPNYTEGTEDGVEELWQTESIMPTEDDRTWRDVFTEIRDKMTKLVAADISDIEGNAFERSLYEDDWKPVLVSPRERVTIERLLEHFILGKVPWPMKHDNPRPYRGWKAKHTTTNQEFNAYSLETLADLYSDEWETDKEDGEGPSDSEDTDGDYGADDDDNDDDEEMDDFDDDEYEFYGEDEGMDDFDFAQMNHVMQAIMPSDFGSGAPGHDDEWEDEDDEDVEMDEEDSNMPGAVDIDALGGEFLADRLSSLIDGAGPVGTGVPGGWGMTTAAMKAAFGYESDPDEL